MLFKWKEDGFELYKPVASKLVGLMHNGSRPDRVELDREEICMINANPDYWDRIKDALKHLTS